MLRMKEKCPGVTPAGVGPADSPVAISGLPLALNVMIGSIEVKLRPQRSIHSMFGLNFKISVFELKCAISIGASESFVLVPLASVFFSSRSLSHGCTTRKNKSSQLLNGPRGNLLNG